MSLKRNISFIIILLVLISFTLGSIPPSKVKAATSYDKAEIYVRISSITSYNKTEELGTDNLSGKPDISVLNDNFSITLEGTTKVEADFFASEEDYKELLPVERDIKARCGGSGSINTKGTKVYHKENNHLLVRDFPHSYQENWSYSMDGKELTNEYDEVIELIHSIQIFPPDKKGEMPTYEIEFNTDALSAINYYHVLTKGFYRNNWQNFEGSHTDRGDINEGGSYGSSITPGTAYMEAMEHEEARQKFAKGTFKLEKDEFVSSGHLTYTYQPDEHEICTVNVQYTINRAPQIKDIQVNQVLGRYEYTDEDNYVPATDFVAGKETAIQVFLYQETPVEKVSSGTITLDVYRDSAKITTLTDFKRDKDNNALIFMPNNRAQCENWKEGIYKFTVKYLDSELDLDQVKFTKMPKYRVLAVPVIINSNGTMKSPKTLSEEGQSLIKKVFPLAREDILWKVRSKPLDCGSFMYNITTPEGRWKVSEALKRLQVSEEGAQYDAIIGFVPETGDGSLGFTYCNLSVIVQENHGDLPATVAHEISHLYHVGDEYYGGFYNTGVNMPPYGYRGMDWYRANQPASGTDKSVKEFPGSEGVLVSKNLHPYDISSRGLLQDVVGFMGGGANLEKIWISPNVWRHLFSAISAKGSQEAVEAAGEVKRRLRPSGTINDSGELDVSYPWQTTYIIQESDMEADMKSGMRAHDLYEGQLGTYSIQALDASGNVLASQDFTPTFSVMTDPPTTINQFSLSDISVPFPEGTAAFQFQKGGETVEEIPVSLNPPVVSITTPEADGGYAESKTIEWSGGDPDGDDLFYTVEYSHNGAEWEVLAADITDTRLSLDFAALPGGDEAVLRIIASDGIHSTRIETDTFEVPTDPPVLFIEDPVVSKEGVILNAGAYDRADGWLYDERITFRSDKDGEIGKSSPLFLTDLSKGEHNITISAVNDHGQKVEEQINIMVDSSMASSFVSLPVFMSQLGDVVDWHTIAYWIAGYNIVVLLLLMIAGIVTKTKR